MVTLEQAAHEILWNAHQLEELGYDNETVAEFVRLWGARIFIASCQAPGVYVDADDTRRRHDAVPGWYTIEAVFPAGCGPRGVLLRSEKSHAAFITDADSLRAVLWPNLQNDVWELYDKLEAKRAQGF